MFRLSLPLVHPLFLPKCCIQADNWPAARRFFFSSRPSLLGCSSSMVQLYVYCSGVVLQAQQVWPRFGSLGQEPDGFMTQVLHAWLTCQLQVSEALPDWYSLSLTADFLASSGAVGVASPGWVSQTYTEVCALTFTLMETAAVQDCGEWGCSCRREGGRMKCQAGWPAGLVAGYPPWTLKHRAVPLPAEGKL